MSSIDPSFEPGQLSDSDGIDPASAPSSPGAHSVDPTTLPPSPQLHDVAPSAKPLSADETGTAAQVVASNEVTASQELVTPLANLAGRHLSHFRVQDQLGAGAMSTVYRAVDERSGKAVALKVLLPGADSVARSRFQQEARTAAQLNHPHIVHTYEVGETNFDSFAFISMDLIEGESLADLLERNRQLSIFDTCLILERVARALDYAHQRNIVHRDVKPSNILLKQVDTDVPGSIQLSVLDQRVVPLLSDFGIARAMDAPELTAVGRTVGTPSYMAPEQCSGSHAIDGRADIYALGTVFYRALVGRPPFVGTTTQVLYAHVYGPLTIPDEVLVHLPMPVIDILRRSLAKRPQERYATAAAMAIDMVKITGNAVVAYSDGTVEMDEITTTMTALPSTVRQSSTATVLVPASPSPTQTAPAAVPPRRETQPSSQRTESRRELNRVTMGVGLALAALAVLLIVGVVRGLGPAINDLGALVEAGTPAAASLDSIAESDATGADRPDGEPAAGGLASSNGNQADESPTLPEEAEPTPVPIPSFDIGSLWTDAQVFYGDRDWPSTLDRLIALLRTDDEFNQRLATYDGPPSLLIKQLFLDNPDNAYWVTNTDLFDAEIIGAMLVSTLDGLAVEATQGNRIQRAADYYAQAVALQPDDDALRTLAAATDTLRDASLTEIPEARKSLQATHALLAADAADAADFCKAAEHLSAAQNLQVDLTLNSDLARYQDRCAAAIVIEQGQTALPPLSGTLLYSSSQDRSSNIYTIDTEAGSRSDLLLNEAALPSLSPDGRRLSFFSTRADNVGLSMIEIDGRRGLQEIDPNTTGQRITRFLEDGREGPAAWASDSDRVAFASTREGDRRARIYTGWSKSRDSSATIGYGSDPAWRPGQEWIVHNGTDVTGNNPGLWLRRSDGASADQLTNFGSDLRPSWSTDGNQIVFSSSERDGNWEIYRLDMIEGTVDRLTDHAGIDVSPAVSPDGSAVAFFSNRDGAWAVWVVPIDGGQPSKLLTIVGTLPDWRLHSIQWIE